MKICVLIIIEVSIIVLASNLSKRLELCRAIKCLENSPKTPLRYFKKGELEAIRMFMQNYNTCSEMKVLLSEIWYFVPHELWIQIVNRGIDRDPVELSLNIEYLRKVSDQLPADSFEEAIHLYLDHPKMQTVIRWARKYKFRYVPKNSCQLLTLPS